MDQRYKKSEGRFSTTDLSYIANLAVHHKTDFLINFIYQLPSSTRSIATLSQQQTCALKSTSHIPSAGANDFLRITPLESTIGQCTTSSLFQCAKLVLKLEG